MPRRAGQSSGWRSWTAFVGLALFALLLVAFPDGVVAKVGLDLEWRPIEGTGRPPGRTDEGPSGVSGRAGEIKTYTVKGVSFKMVRVPAGEFLMGSPPDELDRQEDEVQHRVRISKDFWVGQTEVTQGLWKAVMGSNPSRFSNCGDDCPVEMVSWEDCQEFIQKLNGIISGGNFRLPTEAEWEYTCRAGTNGPYAGELDAIGWYGNNSGNRTINTLTVYNVVKDWEKCTETLMDNGCRTHPVGGKEANAWGLHDMHGNVFEWCQNWKEDYPLDSVTDSLGPSTGLRRVVRGGAWNGIACLCRSASRLELDPRHRSYFVGLRLAAFP
jgi:formylglycine-generating enzyme required for sulfatase activity